MCGTGQREGLVETASREWQGLRCRLESGLSLVCRLVMSLPD